MTTTTTPATGLEFPLSTRPFVTVESLDTAIRVRAVDGRTARVHLVGGELSAAFRIGSTADRLEIRLIKRWPFGWSRVPGPLEVDVPRDAAIDVKTASGDVVASDVSAGATIRSASGDVELTRVGGRVDVGTMSGAVSVAGSSTLALATSTVSGRIEAIAPAMSSLDAHSMSGSVRVQTGFDGDGPFSLETVSGEVTIGTDVPIRLMPSTISGDVRSEVGWPADRSGGVRSGPHVRVRTISGRIRLVAWSPVRTPAPTSSHSSTGSDPNATTEDRPRTDATTSAGAETAAMAGDANADSEPDDARLAILRALARGDITVGDAEARIQEVEGTSDD